ncbi:tRNA pseudouridine(55) synthase TruB [Inmirania thermothiophila]|uniref:tRNA pseudouridine synthase B n=1 Tax=Inmirania thermothiophila TaxID=1750597 RepID=A0A3N1XZR0_9GAMM|nr:tRNA pseudouridine(55) synthase TruB [Inmirania thermothiophila]ROR32094.1 tRNA pseudouridine synthase B [Inmirania thermothiophila]
MSQRRANRRNVSGVLLLDKPPGITSNRALQIVKRLYRARKAGHTGSLDPLASGLLPVCLGEATKLSGFLLGADKRYWVRVRLGVRTETGDADGAVVEERPVPALERAAVEAVLARFRGEIEQIPPMYSALRHQGERLYRLARQGQEVERRPRRVTIHALALVGMEGETLEIEVHCSKGTYIRTLAEDIGEALGCGGHVAALRRTGVGPYGAEGMVTLEQVREAAEAGTDALDRLLLPMESALAAWPEIRLDADAAYYLRQGQPVLVPRAPTAGWVRLYAPDAAFLGVGEILDDGRVAPRRLVRAG